MMTRQAIKIQNLKCGGCSSTIINRLEAIASMGSVEVDLATDTVSL
jgi:copper chaperone CopZ